MRTDGRATLILAVVTAVICLATGAAYLGGGTSRLGAPDPSWWLATLALLGGFALAAAGLWQHGSGPVPRLIALVVLATLSGGYVAANVLALVQSSVPGWPGGPRPLHVLGTAAGSALYVLTLVEASRAFARRRSAGG